MNRKLDGCGRNESRAILRGQNCCIVNALATVDQPRKLEISVDNYI